MQQIKAAEFQARCLQLLDEVAATQESLLIVKNGQPICQIVPYRRKPLTLYGACKGSIIITGDIVAPLDEPWEALQ